MDVLLAFAILSIALIIAIAAYTLIRIEVEEDPLGLVAPEGFVALLAWAWFRNPDSVNELVLLAQKLLAFELPSGQYPDLCNAFAFFGMMFGLLLLVLSGVRRALRQGATRVLGGVWSGTLLMTYTYIVSQYSSAKLDGRTTLLLLAITFATVISTTGAAKYFLRKQAGPRAEPNGQWRSFTEKVQRP